MRIMLDTNVIISALLFPSKEMDALIESVFNEHSLVMASYVVEELRRVVDKKFPSHKKVVDSLLQEIRYEEIETPNNIPSDLGIRDVKDSQILFTAVTGKIDILMSGDKDFTTMQNPPIEILTPKQFLHRYVEPEE